MVTSSFQVYRHSIFPTLFYMYMKNVCFDLESTTIYIYGWKSSSQPNFLKENIFHWTHMRFRITNQTFPSDQYYVLDENGIWLQSIWFHYHVSHFFESVAVPFFAFFDPNFFQGPVYFWVYLIFRYVKFLWCLLESLINIINTLSNH